MNRREMNKATGAQKIKGEKRNLIEKKGVWGGIRHRLWRGMVRESELELQYRQIVRAIRKAKKESEWI